MLSKTKSKKKWGLKIYNAVRAERAKNGAFFLPKTKQKRNLHMCVYNSVRIHMRVCVFFSWYYSLLDAYMVPKNNPYLKHAKKTKQVLLHMVLKKILTWTMRKHITKYHYTWFWKKGPYLKHAKTKKQVPLHMIFKMKSLIGTREKKKNYQ